MALGAAFRSPAATERHIILSQNRRLIASVDQLLETVPTTDPESLQEPGQRSPARKPKPLPRRWTKAAQKGEAAKTREASERVERVGVYERRAADRALRLLEMEQDETVALMSDDQATIDAAHIEYAALEAEEAADETEALAMGDVLHVVEGELELEIEIPSNDEGWRR